jgi:hypothetical protein
MIRHHPASLSFDVVVGQATSLPLVNLEFFACHLHIYSVSLDSCKFAVFHDSPTWNCSNRTQLVRNNPITHKQSASTTNLSWHSLHVRPASHRTHLHKGNEGDDDEEEKGQTRKRKRTLDKNQEVEAGMDLRPGDSEVTSHRLASVSSVKLVD